MSIQYKKYRQINMQESLSLLFWCIIVSENLVRMCLLSYFCHSSLFLTVSYQFPVVPAPRRGRKELLSG